MELPMIAEEDEEKMLYLLTVLYIIFRALASWNDASALGHAQEASGSKMVSKLFFQVSVAGIISGEKGKRCGCV